MRLFSNSNGMQVPYGPIFDGRQILGMSLLSKKYINLWLGGVEDLTRETSQKLMPPPLKSLIEF